MLKFLLENPATTFLHKARNIVFAISIIVVWVMLSATTLQAAKFGQFPFFAPVNPFYGFFSLCILAPLWEELAFRYGPLRISKVLGKETLIPTMLVSSIIFGLGHGSVDNILIQGVAGFVLCCLYLKNNYSYISCVITHASWNLLVAYILPLFF
jgi:membrane protease YdiL (CAAX protease family)